MSVRLVRRSLPSGNVQLYLSIRHLGKQWQETRGFILTGDRQADRDTIKMARLYRDKRQAELNEARTGVSVRDLSKESFTDYMAGLIAVKTNKNTNSSWQDALDHFRAYANHNKVTFGELTREFLEGFRKHLLNQVSRNSAQIYFARIKTALYQAVKDRKIGANPAQFITIRKEDTVPVFLEISEVRTLAKTPCANEHVKNAFLFACFTCPRCSDLKAIRWQNVQGAYLVFKQQKTGHTIRVPLSGSALRILDQHREVPPSSHMSSSHPDGTIFLLPRQSVIDKQLKAWAAEAGIGKSLSMHKARHTFATLAFTAGADIYTTSKLLGHRSLATTQRYAQVLDEKLNDASKRLPRL